MAQQPTLRTTSPRRAVVIRFQPDDKHGIREATALAEAGFDVDLIMLRSVAATRFDDLDPRVRVVEAPLTKRRGSPVRYAFEYSVWFAFCTLWLTKESLRRRYAYVQVDSLPDHQVFCAAIPKLLGARVGLFLKEPTKELCQSMTGSSLIATLAGWVALRSIAFADVAFCVTEPHRQSYVDQGAPPEKLHVVLNATQPFPRRRRSREPDDGAFVVVCHGTIEKRYGHTTIVEAAKLARAEVPGLSVRLPGRGTYADDLAETIKRSGLSETVSLDGWLAEDELAQLLADADVGVVAQSANQYSHLVHTLKMYDYMSAGVAVVASRLTATESLFPTEVTYFEPGDAADLARVWVALSTDRQRQQEQVDACHCRLAELGWEAQMKIMVNAISASF